MKNKILILFAILALYSCQSKTESKSIIKTIVQDTLYKTIGGTADVSNAPAKDDKAVELIRKQLNVLLKKDIPAMTKEDRFFYYEAFDLNNDKKNEYFVGFSNSYFCGSGGCSGYILNNDGSVINHFTVTNFPIYVTTSSTEKFYDLLMKSGGLFHHIKMRNGKYPANPSIEVKWKGDLPKESTKVLDIYEKKLEKYSF
ncbi:hypothetical protein DBB36_17860 [Flavobacterium sp. WLB]|uniref:hypothetical protein n=1 Tax=unclassified Flavobacterium TaxID=196869 RepID=UPI0006AB7ADE|nr:MULTISPECIES: hypothetical protein [unclassified Flavobacterium]KOP39569.1 hypothetical protein AKO67_03155 [Flavobacterium sp. VMW]OWU90120.1 hypothetical protein APR43_13640 [Flavobacterium sp. NLM]PUU68638.1 hypothetical protein DBB36_17860 [Flavobacterium sp. WLB]